MAKRLGYNVIYATSEDPNYPACELNNQCPSSRGWRSNGRPPHELLLRLTDVCTIYTIQLLAHHQLIPSSVEVLVTGGLEVDGAQTPCGALYTSIGKILLAAPQNEAASRELRSASFPMPTIARFVKLKISAPHESAHHDQVSLMAVNILGVELTLDSMNTPGYSSTNSTHDIKWSQYDDLSFVMYVDSDVAEYIRRLDVRKKLAVAEERFEYARRLKSISSSLTAVGLRIGRWNLRKRLAVSSDDFETASAMRDRIAAALEMILNDEDVHRLLEVDGPDPRNDQPLLEEYDLTPYLTPNVDNNTFTLSIDIPSPAPERISETYDENDTDIVVDDCDASVVVDDDSSTVKQCCNVGVDFKVDSVESKVSESKHKAENAQTADVCDSNAVGNVIVNDSNDTIVVNDDCDTRRRTVDSPRRSLTPNSVNGSTQGFRRRNKSAGPRSTFEAYEEKLVPALLKHSQTNEYLRDCQNEEGSVISASSSTTRPQHKLTERDRKNAALPILIFGENLVEKFFSKHYQDKDDGLQRLKSELKSTAVVDQVCSSVRKSSPNKTARAASILLQRLLKDKVFTIFTQTNELIKILFQEYIPGRVCSGEVGRCLDRLLPDLLKCTGDPTPRVHSTAQHTILTIADCPSVKCTNIIPQTLVRAVPASTHPRLALSRLQMLEQLIETHGFTTDKNGLTVRRVSECGAAGSQHADGAVRLAAERILLKAYTRSPRIVRAQLPPDDAVTRRNILYRHLFQQFDRIDMQKMLNRATPEDPTSSMMETINNTMETSSMSASTYSCMTSISGMTTSLSATTLAPSSISSTRSRSSLKKTSSRRLSCRSAKDESYGFDKLRLDSAVSPKHSPRHTNGSEKVHFSETNLDKVAYRKSNSIMENRHSMIHYENEPIGKRPHVGDRSNATSKSCELLSSEPVDRIHLESPRTSIGFQNITLDEGQMDESGYYSPGDSRTATNMKSACKPGVGISSAGLVNEGFQDELASNVSDTKAAVSDNLADVSSDGNVDSEYSTRCGWCRRLVRVAALQCHRTKRCFALAACPNLRCQKLLPARKLHAHILDECNANGEWRECIGCSAALRGDEGQYHQTCTAPRDGEWKCPYCLCNVKSNEEIWQRHLMRCIRNPRVITPASPADI